MSEPEQPPRAVGSSVHVALLVVQVAFASLAVEGKVAMSPQLGVSPAALAMARITGGALVFVAAHLFFKTPRVRTLADAATLAALSLFGIVVNQALFLAGLRRTSPMSATLLVATIPVFTALLAALTGRGKLTSRSAAGIALAVAGVVVLTGFTIPARGDAFVMLNSLSYAVYVVFAKGVLERYGTLTVMAWVFGCGALLFAPFGAPALAADVAEWSRGAAAMVAFIVLVPTILAYSLNAWALRRASPGLVTIYIYVQPIAVALLAYLQLHQAIASNVAIAALLVLGGVGLVVRAPLKAPARV